MPYLVFDIETIPDHTAWSPSTTSRKTDPFPPVYAHQVIALGHLWLNDDLTVKSFGCAAMKERDILGGWAHFIGEARPTLVSWNGRGFDVPVLFTRAFRWGVAQEWYSKEYRHRYNDDHHLDLLDAMTDFGTVAKTGFKLDAIAKLIGLPGKIGIDGSMVAQMYAAGGLDKIVTYCKTDVLQTAFVLLRFLLVRGRITRDAYVNAATGLLVACREPDGKKPLPEFAEFFSALGLGKLLLDE